MWKREPLSGVVADQSLPLCRRKRGAHRDHDVAHRRIAVAPSLLGFISQPRDKLRQGMRRHVHEPDALTEVAMRVLVEQTPVLLARALAEPALAGALVAVDPLAQELAEPDGGPHLKLPARVVGNPSGSDLARLCERACELLALLAARSVDDDVAAALPVDARRGGPDQLAGVRRGDPRACRGPRSRRLCCRSRRR